MGDIVTTHTTLGGTQDPTGVDVGHHSCTDNEARVRNSPRKPDRCYYCGLRVHLPIARDDDRRLKPLALTYAEAGRLISRSGRTIRRMVERGDLAGLEGHALVSYRSLEEWVAGRMTAR